ncbi:RRP15 protein [Schistosoma japonicum]|nr:RRP15 protein [Schistosoma japonicum]
MILWLHLIENSDVFGFDRLVRSIKNKSNQQAYASPIAFAGIRRDVSGNIAHDRSSHDYLSEFAREKRLRCQATRGTVALFNAVKQHQANIGKQLQESRSGFEEEKILTQITTSDFLDRLSAGITSSKLSKTH